MSLLGTMLVLGIVSVVILLWIVGIIFDRVSQQKQEDLRRKREAAQRRSATVVSIEHQIDWAESFAHRGSLKRDKDTYYLMVEWMDPETQRSITSPTMLMPAPCRYHPGDEVFIYVHPALESVWLDIPHRPGAKRHLNFSTNQRLMKEKATDGTTRKGVSSHE